MELRLLEGPLAGVEADVLVVLAWDKDSPVNQAIDDATGGWLKEIYEAGEFAGKLFELSLLHRPVGMKAKRLAIVGAGPQAKFTSTEMRKVAGAAIRSLKAKGFRKVHFALDPAYMQAAAEGVLLGDYEPDQLKTKDKKSTEAVTFVVETGGASTQADLDKGRIVGEAANLVRTLQNEPSNLLTPLALAERARQSAAETSLEVEVLDEARMTQLGMGSLLGVAQGSDNPPALIILRYTPEQAKSDDHVALIGKGVTFDTGGVSIKPADGMEKMKYDMSGGAAAIGAMRAIAQLKPSVRVTAYIPAVENMVSGRAQRPGDIVKSLNGKTIEVLNTDAEGRLILADAITYAIREGCTHLVDAATLTGAIVVALGHLHMGAFTNHDEFFARVQAAGKQAGERMWQMPLDEDYKEYLKSPYADLPNIGGRWGGAITAAKFLEEFVEDKPWVHLDIAGTAWLDDGKPWMAKGPSAVPMRTFVNLVMNW